MTYKLVECANSFFIVDAREKDSLSNSKYPAAYVSGTNSYEETNVEGWKRRVTEPVIGAREFAEAIVEALNARDRDLAEHQAMLDACTAADAQAAE